MKEPSNKKLDKKTVLIFETSGIILGIIGFTLAENMMLAILLLSIGASLMVMSLFIPSNDKPKTKTPEEKSMTQKQISCCLIFSIGTFGLIGFFVLLENWVVVMIILFLIGDFAIIFLYAVLEDFRDKYRAKKHERNLFK